MNPLPVGTTFYRQSDGKHRITTVIDYVKSNEYLYRLGETVIDPEKGTVKWFARNLYHSEMERYLDESHFLAWKRIDHLDDEM